MSTKTVNARDRIGSGPWYNAKGVKVADSVADLHSENNRLGKENSVTEGAVVGRGDQPNMHDILTGSNDDGTRFTDDADHTCSDWTSSGEGSARSATTTSKAAVPSPTPGTPRTPRAAAVRRTCRAPAATATSTVSPPTRLMAGRRVVQRPADSAPPPAGSAIIASVMQLGFVSAILPDLSLEQVFELADTEGYDCVEVMCWPPGKASRRYAGVTHIDVTALDDADVDAVREIVEETGVAISGLGYYPNCLSPDAAESDVAVEHLKRVITAAPKLDVSQVNTFIGRDWTQSVDENWPRFLAVWKPLIAFAEERGVRIGIENCPMSFGRDEWPGGKNLASSPAIWRRMFNDIPSESFGLNYDPSHLVWQMMDPIEPLWEFRERIFHAHAKDVRLDRAKLNDVGILAYPSAYHTPKLPGMGDVNWGRFFSVLTDIGYDGPVCVEVEDRAYEGSIEARCASLRQSAAYLRNFVPELYVPDILESES